MKKSLLYSIFVLCFVLLPFTISAQEIGAVRFLGHLTPPQGGSYIAGCWGWTDTLTGREYAILGSYCGTSFVEITNTGSLVERDFLPNVCSSWKEIQTHENYAYVVSEGGGGVQIIDLSYLPDSVHLVTSFTHTNGSKNTSRVHSIHIKDGYMYLNGCANWSPGGIVIFSLANPVAPTFVGEWGGNYIHDCYVRNDTIFGAAIYGQGMQVIKATNKAAPTLLYTVTYSGAGTHNTSTTTDGRYVLTTDEIGSTAKTLKIWDVTSAPSFTKVAEYVGSPTAIVHNVFVKGNLAIMSYYTAGMRVVDITDPENPSEIGGYDTYTSGDPTDYDGAWSVYPFFPSGKIIIGDMSSGLYVVDINLNGPKPPTSVSSYSDYQTPTSISLAWADPTLLNNGNPLSDFKIHIYRNSSLIAEVDSGVGTYTDNGLTTHQFYTYMVSAVTTTDSSTLVTSGVYAGGHSTPNSPTSFGAVDNVDGALLTWTNPSRQVDNTPLNDLAYIIIYRDGSPIDSLSQAAADTGQSRSFVDSVSGYHSYYIKARDNETPRHYSTATTTFTAYGKASLALSEPFDSDVDTYERTGSWDVTPVFAANGSQSLADSPFGVYDNNTTSYIIMPPVILGDKPILEFKHAAIVALADFAFVELSNNQRQSFINLKAFNKTIHSEWQDGELTQADWIQERFDLSAYANQTVNIRFRLVTNASNIDDGWFIDDFYLGPSEKTATVSVTPETDWNLVSVPLNVSDKSVTTLFPGASSSAFRYSGGYSVAESLQLGIGYWLKFDSTQTFNLEGTTAYRETLDVGSKWNILGSITESFLLSKIKTIPNGIIQTPFYTFDGGYQTATTIEPGKGYWVKTSQAGKFVLSNFSKSSPSDNATNILEQMNSLTIKDQEGRQQKLYFGRNNGAGTSLEQFELPPLPPSGAYDVRFSSHRSVEIPESEHQRFPILLQSVKYPVTIVWNVQTNDNGGWQLETDRGPFRVSNHGSTTLNSGNPVLLFDGKLSKELPTEFSLEQNFPNPFNPSTTFNFSISEYGLVTLKVYNLLGEEVTTLVNEAMEAGVYSKVWDASNLPSGVYTYKLTAGSFSDVKKLVLLR